MVRLGIPDRFIEHSERPVLLAELGLDLKGICETVRLNLDCCRSRMQNESEMHCTGRR